MLVSVFEVALFAVVALCLLAPWRRGAVRRVWPATAGKLAAEHAEPGEASAAAGANEGGRSATERDPVRRRWAGRIGGTLGAIAVTNFLAFSVHTRSLGGSAFNGKQAEGRYYVASHGRFTEVTEQQWRGVWAHQVAVFVTHPLGLVVGGALLAYSQRWWGRHKQAEPAATPDPARTSAPGAS